MPSFHYARPQTIEEAIAILRDAGPAARLLSGGTDLIVRLRLGHIRPEVVVDLKHVAGLRADVWTEDGHVNIGARAVMTDLIANPRIQRHFPALVESARVVGSVQIRNRATLAGNICNASPAADTAPALLVYGAVVRVVGPDGRRSVPLQQFFTGPGKTVLRHGDLVEAIELPLPDEPSGSAFGRVTRRKGVDLATINLCCLVTASGRARFAYGAVAPTPVLAVDDTGALGPTAVADADREAAFGRMVAATRPISDVRGSREYRSAMLTVMTRRSWSVAIDRLRHASSERHQ